jgi:hypothetical protein
MFGANCAPILRQDYSYLPMDRIELPHEPRHLGVPPVVSKTIYEPLEYLAQTVHRSSVKITTISKQIEPSLHLSLVTKEYHRVRPK